MPEDSLEVGVGFVGLATGLLDLIDDVQCGRADFSSVLVFDVSRWGRFQEVGESPYYEFICKRAGIKVTYCAELFGERMCKLSDSIVPSRLLLVGWMGRPSIERWVNQAIDFVYSFGSLSSAFPRLRAAVSRQVKSITRRTFCTSAGSAAGTANAVALRDAALGRA